MTLKHTDSDLAAALAKGREEMRAAIIDGMEQSIALIEAKAPWDETKLFLKAAIREIRALSPSSPGEPDGSAPLPAPPHERSEGEQTERPGAVDPSDEDTGQHIAVSYGTGPECANAITTALAAARNAGRKEMRERAARAEQEGPIMTDLTTLLRDLSEKAAKAPLNADEATDYFNAVSHPALIQALVDVVMQANAYRDGGWDSRELCKALDRLEAVARQL